MPTVVKVLRDRQMGRDRCEGKCSESTNDAVASSSMQQQQQQQQQQQRAAAAVVASGRWLKTDIFYSGLLTMYSYPAAAIPDETITSAISMIACSVIL